MWPLIHYIRQRLLSGVGLIKPALGSSERYRINDTAVIALTSIALLMALIDETPKAIRPLYWSLGATSAIAALAVGATIWLSAATQSQNDWVRHTLAVRNQIAQILSLVQSAETGQRGYLLTNSQAYLIPYDRGTAAVGPAIDELGGLVIDNPQQEQSVGRLRELVKAKLDELGTTIEDQKSGRIDQAMATVKSDDGLKADGCHPPASRDHGRRRKPASGRAATPCGNAQYMARSRRQPSFPSDQRGRLSGHDRHASGIFATRHGPQ